MLRSSTAGKFGLDRKYVGAGGYIVGMGLIIGMILYFLIGENPIHFFGKSLSGMSVSEVTEKANPRETDPATDGKDSY